MTKRSSFDPERFDVNRGTEVNMISIQKYPMNPVGQPSLAPIRPEKLDESALQKQISLIQQACPDIAPDLIAVVFHECDYNTPATIARLNAGDYQDGGWQTAKSNHKKKMTNTNNPHPTDTIPNGSESNEGERSHGQRTSPRTTAGRRGNYTSGNTFLPSNSHHANSRSEPSRKVNSNENVVTAPSPSSTTTQPEEHLTMQFLTVDNVETKSSVPSVHSGSSKRRVTSSIPRQPVVMHRTVQLSHKEVDIQFGDIQWKNSVAIAVSPSESESSGRSSAEDRAHERQCYSHDPNQSSVYPMANEIDASLSQATNHLSMANNILSDNLPETMSRNGTSPSSTQYLSGGPMTSQISTTDSLSTSASAAATTSGFTSPGSHTNNPFVSNTLQHPSHDPNLSTFVPFSTPGSYPSIANDYPSVPHSWNSQPSTHRVSNKASMMPAANYSGQALYQISSPQQPSAQQQQIFVGHYPYSSPSPTMLLMPVDPWPANNYTAPLDPYTYSSTSYLPPYPSPSPFHPPSKYEHHGFESDFLGNYGQPRSTTSDGSHAQQSSVPSPPAQQPVKEITRTSKLSANAPAFSHRTPMETSSPTSTGYASTSPYSMPPQYSSIDNRDNHYSVNYGASNHRNNYYHPGQQQRSYQNNTSNNNWHSQQ